MTADEFQKANEILKAHFPTLEEIQPKTWIAWYASFERWPTLMYQVAIRLVCKTVPQWNRGMNLRGVVAQIEGEATEEYRRITARMAEMRESRRIEDGTQTSQEEAKINLARIMSILDNMGNTQIRRG
jgi:hypothetical protein